MKPVAPHALVSLRALWAALAIALSVLVVGGVPGSVSLRPLVVEHLVPRVPDDTRDRDARVDVDVQTADGGAPVPGARVRAFALLAAEGGPRAFLAGAGLTGADGRVTLEALPRGETWILAEAPGLARASSHAVLAEGARPIVIHLAKEHRLEIDVKDERGAPVAAAEIEAVAAGDPLPVGARAGEGGVVAVGRLAAGPWVVTARAAGYEEVTYRGVREGQPLHVTLRRLGALVVRVVGEGDAPAPGARVLVASASLWPARVAEAGNDGRVRLGGLGEGSYALRATSGDRASPIELGVLLARGEEKSVTLRLVAGERVAVRVTEGEEDDAPSIAGARVTLSEAGLSPFPLEATTDREGRARLGPIARGAASLAARAEGFVARGAVAVPDPPPAELRVVLVRGGAAEGRVVDARGYPIDGATIEIVGTDFAGAPIDDDPRRARFRDAHFTATLAGPTPLVPAGELGVMPGPVPPIPHGESARAALPALLQGSTREPEDEPWVTRDDGTFRAAPVSPGRIRALVRHPQYVEALSDVATLAPGGTVKLDVVMHAGGILEGRVVDAAGQPVPGARVVVSATRGSMERATRAATDGTFAFAAVPDAVTVVASLDDDAAQAQARAVVAVPEGGRKTVTLTLPSARPPLAARVTDDRGYAIDAAQITAASLDPASALRTTSFTDERGEATIAGARGLPLRIEVSAPGHATRVLSTDATLDTLAVVLAAAESATGEVRSARGEVLAEAEVVLYTASGARHGRTDARGLFTFGDLAPGDARLAVRAKGFVAVTRGVTIAARAGLRATELARVELAPGGSVEGEVRDAHGDPVAGARVALDHVPTYLAMGPNPPGVAVADARGVFRLADLPEGPVTLEAYAPDVGRARVEGVQVVAGRVARDVRIALVADRDARVADTAAAGGVAVTLGETAAPREVVLVSVAPASEAERAGLAPGDALLEVDGAKVGTIAEARRKLEGALGDDVLVTIRRGERTEALRVTREQVRR